MDALIPIFICCILPLGIVITYFLNQMYRNKKRAQIFLKALENSNFDADKLAEALQKPRKTDRERFNNRLLCGCIFSLTGLFLIITGIISVCCGAEFSDFSVKFFMIFGGILLSIGLSYLIVCKVTRKHLN